MVIDHAAVNAAPPPSPATSAGKGSAVTTVPEDALKWRRDPFITNGARKTSAQKPGSASPKKGAATSSDSASINIQGIMQADKAFHALIDGRTFKKGDKIGQLTISEISRYCVVFQNELKEKITHDIHKGKITRGEK